MSARKHGPLQTLKVCAHRQCGRSFRPWRKDQACCSRSCARKHSPVFLAHLRSVARQGGLKGGRLKRIQAAARWREQVKLMTKGRVAQMFYRKGYNNGRAAKAREEFARGFQAAIDSMQQRDPS